MNMPTCVIDFLRTCKIRCICGKWLNRTSHERVSRWVAWPKNCAGLLQQLALPGDFAGDFIYLLSELPIFPPVAFPVLGATWIVGLLVWKFDPYPDDFLKSSQLWPPVPAGDAVPLGESRPSVHWQQIDRIVRAVLTALENAWSAVLLITAKMQK